MKKIAIKLATYAAMIVAGVIISTGAYVYFNQEDLIFFPDKGVSKPPAGMGVEGVYFTTADGETLHGWWMDNKAPATVLYFHGNAGSLSGREYMMALFREIGVNALMFDYRGYGESTGEIRRESDLYADGEAAISFLTEEKGVPLDRIIIWGHSLGGGVAGGFAMNPAYMAVILESTFCNMEEMARMYYPQIPAGMLLQYRFSTDEKVRGEHAPLLVMHSRSDEIIPFGQGRKLFDTASGPKEFLEITGSHNDGYDGPGGSYVEGVRRFLGRL